jgi:hypothetical protein
LCAGDRVWRLDADRGAQNRQPTVPGETCEGSMRYKPDWPEARERLTALWHGDALRRPCVAVTAPNGAAVPAPPPPEDPEARWLDPDYLVGTAVARLRNTWWGGEALPSFLIHGGWVVSLGGRPRFSPATIWFEPAAVDFEAPPPFGYDPADPWVRKYRTAYAALLRAAGRDEFLVGRPCLLPANDLIALHLGAERFLLALKDHPDWIENAIREGAGQMDRARRDLEAMARATHDWWYGIAGWMPFWAPEPFLSTQSDVSCMLSPGDFDRFGLPELEFYGRSCGPLWYHLDGADARQHLGRLLSLPYLRVLQYTPAPNEPPNGPAHLPFYRRVQQAGKILHLDLPAAHVEALVRQLDPARLMLQTRCPTVAEGERLLAQAERWT